MLDQDRLDDGSPVEMHREAVRIIDEGLGLGKVSERERFSFLQSKGSAFFDIACTIQDEDEKKDQALAAINKALLETKRYLERHESKKAAARKVEFHLAELWADAAAKARYASNEIAIRLNNKSLYWSDNLKWSRRLSTSERSMTRGPRLAR